MDESKVIDQNRKTITDAVRRAFQIPDGEKISTTPTTMQTSRALFDDTGQCKETIGERDIPRSDLHKLAYIVTDVPYQIFDAYEVPEDKFKGGAVAGFLNALGQRKTGHLECTITDFDGNPVEIEFPVMMIRGETPEEINARQFRLGLLNR